MDKVKKAENSVMFWLGVNCSAAFILAGVCLHGCNSEALDTSPSVSKVSSTRLHTSPGQYDVYLYEVKHGKHQYTVMVSAGNAAAFHHSWECPCHDESRSRFCPDCGEKDDPPVLEVLEGRPARVIIREDRST